MATILAGIWNWLCDAAVRLGLDRASRWLGRFFMTRSGVEFFADRATLEKARSIDELMASASDIVAVFVVGRKFREHQFDNARRLTRLILPHPSAESVRHYAESVDDAAYFQQNIVETTRALQSRYGTKIRWHPQMIHYSMMLGDAGKHSGWAQVECALPFSRPNLRPSFTVQRRAHEKLVMALSDVFERMWDASKDPEQSVMDRYANNR